MDMNKIKVVIAACVLNFSFPVFAAAPYGTNYWSAAADIIGGADVGLSIVVTDSTYNDCVTQFQTAMASHASAHGDVFSITKNCSYVSSGISSLEAGLQELAVIDGGNPVLPDDEQQVIEAQFIKDMSALEEQFNVSTFLTKRDALVKQYVRDLGIRLIIR